jgi:hypothetical protein
METVGNLNCVGSPLPATFGVGPGSISNDDLYAGVMVEPVCKYIGGAIVEQINRPVRLEIEEQRAIAALFASQSDVVDTQHAWTTLNIGVDERMQNPQKCVRTDRDTRLRARRAPPSPPACRAKVVSSSVVPSVRRA